MSAKNNNFKIGVFVLIGISILLAALFAFGARSAWEKKSLFETYVPGDVEGLSVGSPVRFRGVHIGKVTRIGFVWNEYPGHEDLSYILVQFEVRDNVAPTPPGEDDGAKLKEIVKKGLRSRVKGQGVTGQSFLSIEMLDPALNPPLEFPWTPRNYYIPSAESQFGQMLASIEKSLRGIEKVDFDELNKSLQRDLKSVGRFLDQVEKVNLPALGANADGLLTEVRASNEKLQALLDQTQGTLKGMKLETISMDADKVLAEIRTTIAKFQPIIDSLDATPLSETLLNARQATEQLNDLLRNLQQYPSGFLFGRQPKPATSVDSKRK